ncbi:hypothetical protein F2Q70_00032243 [Brassica cretica]|uniref:Uncharacterized protein n=1 Tax=Brassica cretica TaxID=69181 RepID=A0A8S9FGD0_BRACR|nr:hypothetical protein F2Q70_00032243 [Brassica cretica]
MTLSHSITPLMSLSLLRLAKSIWLPPPFSINLSLLSNFIISSHRSILRSHLISSHRPRLGKASSFILFALEFHLISSFSSEISSHLISSFSVCQGSHLISEEKKA